MKRDLRIVLAIQSLRALAYGFSSIVMGFVLSKSSLSRTEVGLLLTTMLAGMAVTSIVLARKGERLGRKRMYLVFLATMGISGGVFALTESLPLLALAALTGTLSTDPNESGPITTLEQGMISAAPAADRAAIFGRYNATAFVFGSAGSLAAGALAVRSGRLDQRALLILTAAAGVSVLLGSTLSSRADSTRYEAPAGLGDHRSTVAKLSILFAVDSGAGGFITQTFIVYWFAERFGTAPEPMSVVLAASGLLQALSSLAAGPLAARIGLLRTMVFTHLPSNLLLIVMAFSARESVAFALLTIRFALSQMDVPARQAYVAAVVPPSARIAAAGYTNSVRYLTRPAGPVLSGMVMQNVWIGAPFLVAGAVKSLYDLGLLFTMRSVPLRED